MMRPERMRRLPGARIATSTAFFLSGLAFASWVVRIPDVQRRLSLSEGSLGLALLGVAAGALVAMPFSANLIGRWGSRRVGRAMAVVLAASIALAAHAPGALSLALALVVLGGAKGVFSVSMNSQAAAVERRMRRPVMAGFHAMYSVGGLVGAAIGGLVAGAGVDARWHLGMAGLVVAATALAVAPRMLRPVLEGRIAGNALARPSRPLLLLGLVGFCVLFGEGAAADWSAVYLRDVTGAGAGLAAAGYAAYSLMMATGRFAGDRLAVRLGPARLVRAGGLTAALGVGLALAVPSPWAAILGLGLIGAGLSTIFPTLVGVAGRLGDPPAPAAIAAVSTMGYTGFLVGPPLIGFAAEALSLRVAFGLVGLTCLLVGGLAGTIRPGAPHAAPRAAPAPGGSRLPEAA